MGVLCVGMVVWVVIGSVGGGAVGVVVGVISWWRDGGGGSCWECWWGCCV